MVAITHTSAPTRARQIPALTHAEAGRLARAEFARLLDVVEQLAGDDWTQPTDCDLWTVKDMVAHLAGSCAGYASWREFKRQLISNPYMREEPVKVDAINRVQVEDRAGHTPEQIVAELREVGPKAIRLRSRLPWIVRRMPIQMGPPTGFAPMGYLTDTIYTRDEWMHRLDLCNATGKHMAVTPEHDGRIVALVLRELAHTLDHTHTIDLVLTGALPVQVRFGNKPDADAVVTMDAFEFNRRASERLTAEEARALATVEGDEAAARWFLDRAIVLY